jgi:tRNA(Ile)-lysidine synthase
MPLARTSTRLSRREPTVRALALSWRTLTGKNPPCRRTLLACSGGADSSGLVLALAAAIPNPPSLFVVAHIVHDLRPRAEALADRDAARQLAESLGLPFAESEISVRARRGNAEASARRLRYDALASLAAEHRCPFLASAHHADDQLETLLMSILRGSGPRGLAGVAPRRRLRPGITLIRPALSIRRADLQRLCTAANWRWQEDATNADESRLRAALRRQVAPLLESLRPGAASRAARSAALLRDAAAVIDDLADKLLAAADRSNDSLSWPRDSLRAQRPAVLGSLLQAAAARLHAGRRRDRITGRIIEPAVRALRDRSTEPRRFVWSGLELAVTAHRVQLRRTADA